MTPSTQLVSILKAAYPTCPRFNEVCKHHGIQWEGEKGHLARRYTGCFGEVSEVKLVLILAEPGTPGLGEAYTKRGTRLIGDIADRVAGAIRDHEVTKSVFHRNLDFILN